MNADGIESFWLVFKRGYHGSFHHLSLKHPERYVAELCGRHNERELDTIDQMSRLFLGMAGKRLTYCNLVGLRLHLSNAPVLWFEAAHTVGIRWDEGRERGASGRSVQASDRRDICQSRRGRAGNIFRCCPSGSFEENPQKLSSKRRKLAKRIIPKGLHRQALWKAGGETVGKAPVRHAARGTRHRPRLTPPCSPQTNGMAERFNGCVEEVHQTRYFKSGEELADALSR